MTKRSSDPRVAYPEVKVQIRDLVRVVGIVAPLPHRVGTRGKVFLSRRKWAQEICAVSPAAVRHGRARQCSWTVPCENCRRVLWGQYSGKVR